MAHGWRGDVDRNHGSAGRGLHPDLLYWLLDLELADMTETQLLVLMGTVWVAPHCGKFYSIGTGCVFITVAVCKGLGWV